MSKRNTVLVVSSFLLVIISLRVLWFIHQLPLNQPFAEQGILDLQHVSLTDKNTVVLDGEWVFYPNVYAEPEELVDADDRQTIQVPYGWKESSAFIGEKEQWGTYELWIHAPNPLERYSLKLSRVYESFRLYANGELVEQRQSPVNMYNPQQSVLTPAIATVESDEKGMIHLVLTVYDSEQTMEAGVLNTIHFGTETAVTRKHVTSVALQIMVAAIMLLHGIYASILFFIRPKKIELLHYMMAVLLSACAVLLSDDRLLLLWLPLDYDTFVKLAYLSYTGLSFFFVLFVRYLFSNNHRNHKIFWLVSLLCATYGLFIVLVPGITVREWSLLLLFVLAIPFGAILLLIIQVLLKKEKDSLFLLLAAISILSSIFWSSFVGRVHHFNWGIISAVNPDFYPIDLLLAFLAFSCFWFIRFFRAHDENSELVKKLQKEHVAKDQFLANTSHELRNPLHGMINIAQSVKEQEGSRLTAQGRKNMELLLTVSRRMSYLLNDLVDVTKMKQNKVSLNRQPVDLLSVITSVVHIQQFMMEAKRIRFQLEIPENFPPVYADETRLAQIIFNLLHNAVKFTEDGTIVIEAELVRKRAIITVKDTGIGMDQETQKRIFLPYEQGQEDSFDQYGGLGLGLSICQQLVAMHDGTLSVTSTPLKGSEFTVTLPIAGSAEKRREQQVKPAVKISGVAAKESVATNLPAAVAEKDKLLVQGKPKILAVDDDPMNIHVLQNILSPEEYFMETATSGKEVLQRLEEGWDLIIADVMMPEMTGYELTEAIRKQFSISELPVLLLTARSSPEEIYTGFLSGANDYLVKPIDSLELKVRIHAVIDLKHSIQERLRMEAAWLHAQIQPHFLFNTLNTIASLSEIDTPRMAALLEHFGRFLQKSFDEKNLDALVPLSHELAILEAYVYIEQERFGDRVTVHWEKEQDAACQLPPLSIQPLVENAIRHGILKKAEGGNIYIRIKQQKQTVKIAIADDGVGMSKETMKKVLTRVPDQTRGVGLLNTDTRLKQLYGKGLEITSKPGEGTEISFQVPLTPEREHH
ncbi:Signal transduction histidine kinase [Evansella caseinilytica]|uniref:Circadian input-output histidine kinase CikA n=1 Tax=Evansella caseinilytica TaxID=1503961 RepID=A0A1H3Q6X7_9BACI|nr:ATP-binding protein [Evansella caseinilytica]SDZ08459.1 Signal transduction histidine kinase [Evansella caseinilytica]